MFIFAVDQPQVVYTAEDLGCGIISRIDLRSNVVEKIFSTEFLQPYSQHSFVRKTYDTMSSVKALAQNEVLGGSQLLIGGATSFTVGLLDLRCLSSIPADWEETGESLKSRGHPFVKMWSPRYVSNCNSSDNHRDVERKINKSGVSNVSISGLSFSSDGSSILASYQGDQIYIFNTFSKSGEDFEYKSEYKKRYITTYANALIMLAKEKEEKAKESEASRAIREEKEERIRRIEKSRKENFKSGPRNVLGGHINHATFLKSVSFFGPRDEYVVSGSDTGHLWIWDATSGSLDVEEPEDRTCRVVNFLNAGLIHFPFYHFLISYLSSLYSHELYLYHLLVSVHIVPSFITIIYDFLNYFLNYLLMLLTDESTCNGAVPHPYAPLLCTYGIASDVKLWACDIPKGPRGDRKEVPGLLPCAVNKFIEDDTRYQGRGLGLDYKQLKSEYCDMDRLNAHLQYSKVILIIVYKSILVIDYWAGNKRIV